MKLLTGSTGFIGRNLKESLEPMLTPTKEELDLTNRNLVKDYLFHNKPEEIIHCASNDEAVCLYDNLVMFYNLAESGIPMITFCTGREIEDRVYKNGEYVFSKHLIKELALKEYNHIQVIQIWGCFGRHEKPIRFFADNLKRMNRGMPLRVKEDKLFSYIYIADLINLIRYPRTTKLVQAVSYTKSLLTYAKALKRVTHYQKEIVVEKTNFYNSYVGHSNCAFESKTLEEAIKDYWNDFKNH